MWVIQHFHKLFSQMNYKEDTKLASMSPQGILCTPDAEEKLQVAIISSRGYSITSELIEFQMNFVVP